mgnify:CR=1 FL=1
MSYKKIEVIVDGKKKTAFLIEKTKKRKRQRIGKNRVFEWEEEYVEFYVPSELRGKKWILLPID